MDERGIAGLPYVLTPAPCARCCWVRTSPSPSPGAETCLAGQRETDAPGTGRHADHAGAIVPHAVSEACSGSCRRPGKARAARYAPVG